MNYYERHIGDYLKDTAHLSLLEHGIYSRLLDVYYTRETGIEDVAVARLIGARSKDELHALDVVLNEFFTQMNGVWKQDRCIREIAKYQDKQRKAKASADARWSHNERNASAMRTHTERTTNALPTQSEGNALQTPDTSNQTPEEQEKVAPQRQSAAQPSPPPFDGSNAEVLNGKSVVCIAPNWELPSDWGEDAEALGWQPSEVLREAEKFRQYWVAGKGLGKRRNVKGWRQSWSNWLAKAAERRP